MANLAKAEQLFSQLKAELDAQRVDLDAFMKEHESDEGEDQPNNEGDMRSEDSASGAPKLGAIVAKYKMQKKG